MRSLVPLLLVAVACTPKEIRARRTPVEVLAAAEARLTEREVALNPSGRRPDRLRTSHFCYQAPNTEGRTWERSFAHPSPGPVPFTIDGAADEQATAQARCDHLFRVEIEAHPAPGGGGTVAVVSEWWRLVRSHCEPLGEPLLGVQRCEYGYSGSTAPEAVEGYVYGILAGL